MKYVSTTLVFVVSAFLALGLVMLYSSMMVHREGSFMAVSYTHLTLPTKA